MGMSLLDFCLPPIGSNLHRFSERKINLSGTSISIIVPDNNCYPAPGGEPEIQSYNLYDLKFSRWKKLHKFEPERFGLLGRAWEYKRILNVNGSVADARFHVNVIRMPEFQSLFRPRRLECAIERLIYATPNFSTQESGKNRLDWQIFDGLNRWIRYGYVGERALYNCKEHVGVVWQMPLTDEHLLSVVFRFIYYSDSHVARKRCSELMELVMKSFRVELSADAVRQKAAMEAAYPYEKLSASLPPYTFETAKVLNRYDLIGKVSEQIDYDTSCPDDKFDALVKEADLKQRKHSKDVRRRVLRSHLRFEELERQDYARYISSQPPEFKE